MVLFLATRHILSFGASSRACHTVQHCVLYCGAIQYNTAKLNWAGHVERMKDNRRTKRCTAQQPRRWKRSR